MSEKYLIGIDFGTNETKGCLSDAGGNVVKTTKRSHSLIIPAPGFAEHDPEGQWWTEFKSIIREFLSFGIKNTDIAAIGVSTIMAAVTFLDDDLRPLRNSILYGIDTRAIEEVSYLNKTIGQKSLNSVCTSECTIESFGPKILWVKNHEPDVFAKVRHVTFASGFINARLTGSFAVDAYSVPSAIPMIDNTKLSWDEDMCSYVIPSSMLPEIKHSSDVIGTVTRKAALETGLAEGTPVICGTTDAGAEAVSSGVVFPDDTMVMYGSTAFILHVTAKKEKRNGLWPGPYVLDPYYCICAGTSTAGSITKWARDELAKDLVEKEKAGILNAYDMLFQEAEGISVGSDGVMLLPFFLGQRMPDMNPDATGLITGLTVRHSRGHIVHAAFEGIGYNICDILDMLGQINKDDVKAIGGGTKTPLWLQIVSDIAAITQVVPKVKIGASYGDALIAGLGVGLIKDKESIKKIIRSEIVIRPDMKKHDEYRRYFDIYKKLYQKNKGLMSEMASIMSLEKNKEKNL